jgi:hypothetical protein
LQTAKELSDQVKDRVKELGYLRYKLLVQVTIGEKKGQGIRLASRCMWDTSTDNCASESFETEAIFCVAQVPFIFPTSRFQARFLFLFIQLLIWICTYFFPVPWSIRMGLMRAIIRNTTSKKIER